MMKKIVAMLLTLSLVFSSAAFASAAENTAAGDIHTEQNAAQTADQNGTENIGSTESTGGTSASDTDAAGNANTGADANTDTDGKDAADDTETDSAGKDADGNAAADTDSDADAAGDTKDTDTKTTVKTKTVSKYQKGLAAYIRSRNPKIGKKWSITLAGYFIKSGKKNNIDPKVLMALAQRESNFRSKATSRYGYKGIMQCSASFAKAHGYKTSDLYQADISIEIAAKYLRRMKNKHETYSKAIACFVCGSGAVARGVHSREPGRSVMKTRSKIQDYLEEHHYV